MNLNSLKLLATVVLLSLTSGCKLAVMVGTGGSVASLSSGSCDSGGVCVHEVTNTSYSETFTALAEPGWHFVKWNEGGNFLCENATSPTCVVSNTFLAGNTVVESIVDSNAAYYIQPIFSNEPTDDDIMTLPERERL